jgi:hypothetical protein
LVAAGTDIYTVVDEGARGVVDANCAAARE